MPKNRAEFWVAKLGKNKERDRVVTRTLRKLGWKVLRVWECDLAKKHWPRAARRVKRALEPTQIRAQGDEFIGVGRGATPSA